MILASISNAAPVSTTARPTAMPAATARGAEHADGGKQVGSLGSFDLLDIVDPLHHIPVVSTVYRQTAGVEISPPARMLGGALFMGRIGFIASAFNAVTDAVIGTDISESLFEAFAGFNAELPVQQVPVAQAKEAPPTSAASPAPSRIMVAAAAANTGTASTLERVNFFKTWLRSAEYYLTSHATYRQQATKAPTR